MNLLKWLVMMSLSILLSSSTSSCSLDTSGTGMFGTGGGGSGGDGGKKPCSTCPSSTGSSSSGKGGATIGNGGAAGNGGDTGVGGADAGGSTGTGGNPEAGGFAGSGGTTGSGGSAGNGGTGTTGNGGHAGNGGAAGTGGAGGCCPAICGNSVKEAGEFCDGKDLAGETCKTIPGGYNGGTLKCQPNCADFDVSACTKPSKCGDKSCNGGETCSSCPGDCGGCCGNGAIDPGELCDGANFAGKTCASEKGAGWIGSLSCTAKCLVDNSACVLPCGNNIKEDTEVCDGSDLSGNTCTTVPGGFSDGTLKCKPDCSGYDTSACIPLPLQCTAGQAGTVDAVDGRGVTATGLLIHFAVDPEFYLDTPTTKAFTGLKIPGQFVLAGEDGTKFTLFNGANQIAKTWYKATGNFPNAQCGGIDGFKTQACLSAVAKSFRCQFSPYNEVTGCPPFPVTFVAQPAVSSATGVKPGYEIWLIDLTCP